MNAVSCLEEILDMGVIPIVNENDTICPSVSDVTFLGIHAAKIEYRKFALVTMTHYLPLLLVC